LVHICAKNETKKKIFRIKDPDHANIVMLILIFIKYTSLKKKKVTDFEEYSLRLSAMFGCNMCSQNTVGVSGNLTLQKVFLVQSKYLQCSGYICLWVQSIYFLIDDVIYASIRMCFCCGSTSEKAGARSGPFNPSYWEAGV